MFGLTPLIKLRGWAAPTLALALAGCAGETIHGKLNYDVRPAGERTEVVLPAPPDPPRYRYVGELIGQQNFNHTATSSEGLSTAFKWLVGLFENVQTIQLDRPQYGTVSDDGRVFVVDAGLNAVMVFDPNPAADDKDNKDEGHLLKWKMFSDGSSLHAPAAIAIVWNGDIAVSDSDLGVIMRFTDQGKMLGEIGRGILKRPTGLAFDSARGMLYVADTGANDVKVFSTSGEYVNTIGSAGDDEDHLNAPTHLAFKNGQLLVADTLNSRIQIFNAKGQHLRSFGERGIHVGNLARPKGVMLGEDGLVYVVESLYGHLLVFNDKYEVLMGINGNGMAGDRFRLPSGVWTDKKGMIYVADMFNGRVIVYEFLGAKDNQTGKALPRTEQTAKSH